VAFFHHNVATLWHFFTTMWPHCGIFSPQCGHIVAFFHHDVANVFEVVSGTQTASVATPGPLLGLYVALGSFFGEKNS
jgi:hypothetical protein